MLKYKIYEMVNKPVNDSDYLVHLDITLIPIMDKELSKGFDTPMEAIRKVQEQKHNFIDKTITILPVLSL